MAEVKYVRASRIYSGSSAPAVNRLNLDIADGEFMVLVGPSGCGKSTALRMLAGLEDVDRGEIHIAGTNVAGKPPKERDIAMVFQNYALYPQMTVGENMGFALKLKGMSKDDRDKAVKEAARLLDLEKFLDRKPKALSGGQRQRVAMGRAIVRHPQVFLMDEPLSNLDAKLRVQTRAEIATLQARLGTTTLYVTHDQTEAMTMGHRVAVLKDGLLQQCDSPSTLYDRPRNAFVAGFIGSPAMNIHTYPVSQSGVQVGAVTVPLSAGAAQAVAQHGLTRVVAGVRPESWEIATDGGLPIEVTIVEELGPDAYVYGTAHAQDGDFELSFRTGGRTPVRMGDTVQVRPKPNEMHLFHPETGLRLAD